MAADGADEPQPAASSATRTTDAMPDRRLIPFPSSVFAAHRAVVDVDPELGLIRTELTGSGVVLDLAAPPCLASSFDGTCTVQ